MAQKRVRGVGSGSYTAAREHVRDKLSRAAEREGGDAHGAAFRVFGCGQTCRTVAIVTSYTDVGKSLQPVLALEDFLPRMRVTVWFLRMSQRGIDDGPSLLDSGFT